MWKSVLAISIGASAGALLRWVLGSRLNALFPTLPLGTLAANLIGGYTIGVAAAFFAVFSTLAPEWRLLIITGFCGGLTTFSTFSAEVTTLMQQGRMLAAGAVIGTHLAGSLLMTFAGIGTVNWLHTRSGARASAAALQLPAGRGVPHSSTSVSGDESA
ncbi:MAG TPA: fluoride efflux transporter CrcB [Steroidobacteraceae bacterium]|nr:fluoride efflux transporter CrcB [Steroidobacteraceae bacterium]